MVSQYLGPPKVVFSRRRNQWYESSTFFVILFCFFFQCTQSSFSLNTVGTHSRQFSCSEIPKSPFPVSSVPRKLSLSASSQDYAHIFFLRLSISSAQKLQKQYPSPNICLSPYSLALTYHVLWAVPLLFVAAFHIKGPNCFCFRTERVLVYPSTLMRCIIVFGSQTYLLALISIFQHINSAPISALSIILDWIQDGVTLNDLYPRQKENKLIKLKIIQV